MRFHLSFRVINRWYFTLLISITLYLIFAWSLEHPLAASQMTSTQIPVGRIPIYQIAGFENVTLGQTHWSDLRPTLETLNYSIFTYDVTQSASELAYGVRVSKKIVSNLEDPEVIVDVHVQNDVVAWLEATLSHPTSQQFSPSLWQMLDPVNLISAYGVPDRVLFDAGGVVAYGYLITFYWQSADLVITYEGRVLSQDERGTTFRICTDINRVRAVWMYTAPTYTELVQKLEELQLIDPASELSSHMLVGSTDLAVVSQQLAASECLFTPTNLWDVNPQYTWTPWTGYTDTPTPAHTKTITPTHAPPRN